MRVDLEIVAEHFDNVVALPEKEWENYFSQVSNSYIVQEVKSLLKFARPKTDLLEKKITIQFELEVPDYQQGEKVGYFLILKKVGEGSFGKVFLAHDSKLDREVALKVTPLQGNEAQAMAHLDHEHIVQVFSEETFTDKNLRIICMQYIRGATLADHLRSGLKNYQKVLQIVSNLSRAMELAHSKNILHLDIKPENVLIDDKGKAYLTDFNISRLDNKKGGLIGGTVDYMSPEHNTAVYQADREAFAQLDERADVFSMGVLLRNLITSLPENSVPKGIRSAIQFIVNEATSTDVNQRTKSFTEFSTQMDDLKSYDETLQKLPADTFLDEATNRFPRTSLFLSILVPQIIGSIVNISYNSMQIVSKLNADQRDVFQTLLFVINPVVYGIASTIIIMKFVPVFVYLVKRENTPKNTFEEAIQLCISGPSFLAWVTTVSWASSAVLFPLLIHLFSPSLEPEIFFHFGISFLLSWLIAMTYSFLNAQYFLVRKIFPGVWNLSSLLSQNKQLNLNEIEARMKLFPFFAGAVPMVGALLLVMVGYEKDLLISFILMGMLGLAYALAATKKMSSVLYAFKK